MKSDIYVKKQDGYYFFWFRTGFEEMIAAIDGNGRIRLDKVYQLTETEWRKLHMGAALKRNQKKNLNKDLDKNLKKDLKKVKKAA